MSRTRRISPEQVRAFRVRRSGLVEPFATPERTAERLLGVQAQLAPAAQIAFWNRTKGCTQARLDAARLQKRSLVRFWGQRNTMHLYRRADWPFLHTVFEARQEILLRKLAKAGLLPDFRRLVQRTRKRLEDGAQLTYKDIRAKKLQERSDAWVVAYITFMQLVREGVACHGPEQGGETCFVHREHWCPDLRWSPPPAERAFAKLAQRYLAAYGPAEPRDLAFWHGASASDARGWIESAGSKCTEIEVDGRTLWCASADLDELTAKPPAAADWPARLLYRFDPLLLATKDKSWLVDEKDYKKVWRPSAHVEAVALVRGRIAGTWRYERRSKGLRVDVRPFAKLPRTVARSLERQAEGVAGFLGLSLVGIEFH